ncbi:hypothetical protein LINPERHAP2_LOCUS17092 [Linum perenne]
MLTWVRLPKLSIHFFNHTTVNKIGNHIDRTIQMDLATSEGARARYARVCVEVDLAKPLLGKYMIGERVFFVEYESLENVCHTCGLYGHKADSCPTLAPSERQADVEMPAPERTAETESVGDVGSWMTVTRRRQRKTPDKKVDGQAKKQFTAELPKQGSRFNILRRNGKERDVGGVSSNAKPDSAKAHEVPVVDPISQLSAITERLFPRGTKASPNPPRPPGG